MAEVMNEAQRKTYVAWLNDAHAMELGLVTILEKQVQETGDEPGIQEKIQDHLEKTERHAKLIETCITRNGGTPSLTKDWGSKLTASMQGVGVSFMDDALVKNIHSSYAAEHFEIATYTLLQSAAEMLGDEQTSAVCEQILDDEIDMANWLLEQLPAAAEFHLETEGVEEE